MSPNLHIHKRLNNVFQVLEYPLKISLSITALFVINRILEIISLFSQLPSGSVLNHIIGIRYDFLFAIVLTLIFSPFYYLFYRRSKRWAMLIVYLYLFFIALIAWALSEYYAVTQMPLDRALLIYPISEIIYITKSSYSFSIDFAIKLIIIVTSAFIVPYLLVSKVKFPKYLSLSLSLLVVTVLVFFHNITPDLKRFETNQPFYQQINKTSYLGKGLIKNSALRLSGNDDIKAVAKYYQRMNGDEEYLNPNYPFLKRNTGEDVIGSYFKFKGAMPNFVFIIVESLSRGFSGPEASMGSFTPFLDSLATQSLYWSNFLTTSERTFNVLPSTLASLPYGKKGFMALVENNSPYPDFHSLTGILSNYGYKGHFLYGGWDYFDFMSVFLKNIGVDIFLNEDGFNETFEKIQSNEQGFTWGYPDDAVFRRALQLLETVEHEPRIDIYLTLSMHDPFFAPSYDYWESVFYKRLDSFQSLPQERAFYLQRKHRFATILYADNAIKWFFREYAKRTDYENTIFIILGDHYMPLGSVMPIEKYHVPLIIFSPLLKQSKLFPAVSASADITPTLLGMMQSQFNVRTPQWVHWLGTPLDTASHFQSKKFVPFMRVNRSVDEMLWNDYFLSEDRAYRLTSNLQTERITDEEVLNELKALLESFVTLNNYVCSENALKVPNY